MGSRLTGNKEGYPIQERRKGDIALPMEARIKQPKNISHKVILSSWADEVQKMVPEERKKVLGKREDVRADVQVEVTRGLFDCWPL